MLRVRTLLTGVAGSPYYVNMYMAGGLTGPEALAAQTAAKNFWAALIPTLYAPLKSSVSNEVVSINEATGDVLGIFTTPNPFDATFTNGGNPLPRANQALIRINTAGIVGNRRVQGRVIVPGFTTEQTVGGTPALAVRQTLSTAAASLQPVIGVWSRPIEASPDPDAPSPRAGAFFPATSLAVQDKWAILRSRRD